MQEGDRIRFTYQHKEMEGVLVQLKDDHATVKLDSGYNIIVPVEELTGIETEPLERTKTPPVKVKQDPTLPKVSILHTGGTIASKVDYKTGAVVAQFNPEELIALFPELLELANIESKLLANMQSDDMRFAHYNIIARAVLEEINRGVKGVIVTQGTDTLHYTAAALSFALEGLNVPVVVVGSQRSSDRGSSDAATNLMGALRFIGEGIPGVYIAMHETSSDDQIAIIDGLHGRKSHSSRRDAFVSVNAPLVARIPPGKVEIIDAARVEQRKKAAERKPRVLPFKEDLKVGLWKSHPQSFSDELAVYEHYDGLVIEGTGLGHAPITPIDEHTQEHALIRERIASLAKRIPVAMTTQTIHGRVNMNVYSPGRRLLEEGVLGQGCDMPPETAFIKLAWLLSNFKREEIAVLYQQNLRGEISERSPLEDSHCE
jgi:glutamyl-tRNA(Gln) amidotransferase subunit D